MDIPNQSNKSDDIIVCSFCELTFISNNEFDLHMRSHNVEKPYLCTICDKVYAHKSALRKHKLTHTEDKPIFDCNNCEYECDDKVKLKHHI